MPSEFERNIIKKTTRVHSIIPPDLLYKYRDWSNNYHKRLLTHQELYLADPYSLNDPWDGTNLANWDIVTYDECVEMNKYLVFNKEGLSETEIYEKAKKLTDKKEGFYPGKKPIDKLTDYKSDPYVGIVALSAKADLELLWSYYSNGHKGFIVTLRSRILKEYQYSFLEPIVYVDRYEDIHPFDVDTFRKQYFTKLKAWEHESEWRFLINKLHVSKWANSRTIILPKEAIEGVIIGARTDSAVESEIIDSVNTYLPNVSIQKAVFSHSKPTMTFTKLK